MWTALAIRCAVAAFAYAVAGLLYWQASRRWHERNDDLDYGDEGAPGYEPEPVNCTERNNHEPDF